MVIHPGEMVCLLGGNASGKSTTLKTILGIVRVSEGEMYFRGERADVLSTAQRIERGMAVVPENRRIFPKMTVRENLEMGAYLRNDRKGIREDMDYVISLFPRIGERLGQQGGTMSGGEQQMLAMGRALMSRPRLILMDEPSMGLAPLLVEKIFEIIKTVNDEGISVFVVEQNANVALSIADRGYVLQTGEVVLSGPARELLHNEAMKRAYLGEV
jgi:branched-chain amino acid transport system ATP-binding protein